MHPAGLPAAIAGLDRTVVMGVLNVTPDSFSDGGRYLDVDSAVAHGVALSREGADLVDVGGESTRPGAERVSADEEQSRILPVVERLVAEGVHVSIDTMRADTAQAAVAAGACIVNDVSGGRADPAMYAAVAALDVPFVVMHWRGHSRRMSDLATYDNVVTDVVRELASCLADAERAGIDRARVVLDPGLGFAKDPDDNWQLLRALPQILGAGLPVLVGASRKRFLGSLLATPDGRPRDLDARDAATDAITAIAAHLGVWAVRVHDVAGSSDAVRVARAWRAGREHAGREHAGREDREGSGHG